jgi:3-dehydroquinate synthase
MSINTIESTSYSVYFEEDLSSLQSYINKGNYSKVFVLVDRNTEEHCLPAFRDMMPDLVDFDLIEIDPGEENKNIDFCIGVWKTLVDFGADRKSLLINLGGGVVTDMGAFVASTFKRGIDFIQIPTTLLSQVDASVGGKTGIDLDELKNIIGTFANPKAVFISSRFLSTLDHAQWVSGFAEMVKHGLIADADYYHRLKAMDVKEVTINEIKHSISLKNEVVKLDPFEKGLRKTLNFGHTVGHAIEGYFLMHTANPLLHGEAIAMGMICEAYLSNKHNGLTDNELNDIIRSITSIFTLKSLAQISDDDLIEIMLNDKKNHQSKIGFALLKSIGDCAYDHYLSAEMIKESLSYYRQLSK